MSVALAAAIGGAPGCASPPPPRVAPLVVPPPADTARAAPDPAAVTAELMESLRDDPPALTIFLREMPKGADLHSHLGGAAWAEDLIRWAAADGFCIDTLALALAPPPAAGDGCATGAVPLADFAHAHDRVVDAWSVRNWDTALAESGHERFFSTFGRFSPAAGAYADRVLAAAVRRAHRGRLVYLELMETPAGQSVREVGRRVGWLDDLDRLRQRLLVAGLPAAVEEGRRELAATVRGKDRMLACGSAAADPACAVEVRFIWQVLRALPREEVFAQILAGFEAAAADSLVVGLNLVMPEDHPVAMGDYGLHMRMIGHLRPLYPSVKVTLHAGELVPGLVPPEGLRDHIRQAVEVAGAERIGHGVGIAWEERPLELLEAMARRGVLVEVNLTSNDVILGVRGEAHPLGLYLRHGVPVALSTDDEGVGRSGITQEYLRAVREQGVDYPTLKQMARNALTWAFLPGASLWSAPRAGEPVAACRDLGSRACDAFVANSTKARLQRRLERDLAAFEARWAGPGAPLPPGAR